MGFSLGLLSLGIISSDIAFLSEILFRGSQATLLDIFFGLLFIEIPFFENLFPSGLPLSEFCLSGLHFWGSLLQDARARDFLPRDYLSRDSFSDNFLFRVIFPPLILFLA